MPRPFGPLAAVAAVVAGLSACGGDGASAGQGSPRAVVDAHVAAMRAYDLEAQCELLAPARREAMAAIDGSEVDEYCALATADVVRSADRAQRQQTRRIYEDVRITTVERVDGTWFHLESADGTYHEEILPVEVDGGWWIDQVDSHAHDEHDGERPPEDPPAEATPAGGEAPS